MHLFPRKLGLLLFMTVAAGLSPSVKADTNHHVILITIDGFASYLWRDSNAPIPHLRRLGREGAAAEGVRVSNPAITWPNHTTLVTGVHPEKHSVLFNGVLVRPGPGLPVRVDGYRDKSALVAVPTVYDHLHRAGYRVADINWPCTRAAATLEDSFPDTPDQVEHMTPRLREELVAAGLLPSTNQAQFRPIGASRKDQIWTAAALHVLEKRRPNLLLWHMLVTDSIHHKYGPASPASYAALAQVDAQVGELLRMLDRTGLRPSTTVIVTADHGFETAGKQILPNVVFRQAGLLDINPVTRLIASAKAQIIAEGGTALVYFSNPATAADDQAKAIELLRTHEGVAEILKPDQFSALGVPNPVTNRQMGDLILVAEPGYAFNNDATNSVSVIRVTSETGSPGQHGYLSTNPKMNASLIAWGRGIKAGTRLGLVNNIDVAPTIARLLGQKLPGADGQVIEAMLE